MPDDTKPIELWQCGYDVRCNVRNCRAKATVLGRSLDSGNRPIKQYELCSVHADQVAQRERGRGGRPSTAHKCKQRQLITNAESPRTSEGPNSLNSSELHMR
jgi:hypothetical protein